MKFPSWKLTMIERARDFQQSQGNWDKLSQVAVAGTMPLPGLESCLLGIVPSTKSHYNNAYMNFDRAKFFAVVDTWEEEYKVFLQNQEAERWLSLLEKTP